MTSPFPFVSGAVLQAQQLNDITNLPINDQTASYTLVVGDAGKRVIMNNAGATTITVNNSVFTTGDTIFIANKGAGTSTITAGAGVTINSASGLALPQYQSGQLVALSASTFLFFESDVTVADSGLTLINSTTIGSAVSSVTVTGAFSATYNNYRIIVSGGTASQAADITLQLGSTTSGYKYSIIYNIYTSATPTGSVSATGSIMYAGVTGTDGHNTVMDIVSPFASAPTFMTAHSSSANSHYITGNYLNTSTSYTAFTLAMTAGNMTGGTIKVYGYKD